MNLLLVAGARPNFMKIARAFAVARAGGAAGLSWKLVHTGQHYDHGMSKVFFDELEIPEPDFDLGAGSGSHACSGRQELFSRQIPQRLQALREHAIIESAVSSNRIEGVEVEQARWDG